MFFLHSYDFVARKVGRLDSATSGRRSASTASAAVAETTERLISIKKVNLNVLFVFNVFRSFAILPIFFKKWANHGLFFVYFWSFQTNITIFTTIICEKMSIQYTVPGFEPTTYGT